MNLETDIYFNATDVIEIPDDMDFFFIIERMKEMISIHIMVVKNFKTEKIKKKSLCNSAIYYFYTNRILIDRLAVWQKCVHISVVLVLCR